MATVLVNLHRIVHLTLQLLLHPLLSKVLLGWVEDAHGFEVQGTDAAHECFLEILLHHMLVSVVDGQLTIGFPEFGSQSFDLFLVGGGDRLEFCLDLHVELVFVPLHLRCFERLDPSLEHPARLRLFVVPAAVLEHSFCVQLEFPVVFQSQEALHCHRSQSGNGLPFARPKRHDLGSKVVLFALLCFFRKLLFKLLDFVLLDGQQSVASPFLGIDCLFLLVLDPALRFDEFLHRFFSETQNQLIKALSEVFVVHLFVHHLDCTEIHFGA